MGITPNNDCWYLVFIFFHVITRFIGVLEPSPNAKTHFFNLNRSDILIPHLKIKAV